MEQFEKMPSLGSSRLHLVIPFKSMVHKANSTKHETNEFYKKKRADFISGK
jgi:hypothetical protein